MIDNELYHYAENAEVRGHAKVGEPGDKRHLIFNTCLM